MFTEVTKEAFVDYRFLGRTNVGGKSKFIFLCTLDAKLLYILNSEIANGDLQSGDLISLDTAINEPVNGKSITAEGIDKKVFNYIRTLVKKRYEYFNCFMAIKCR